MDLESLHLEIASCRACSTVAGTPVHGPAVRSGIFLLGQAPGPHEAAKGRPFAHTAGRTLFRWFEEASRAEGNVVDEKRFRETVYMAAVARCFPGKAKGGGDRVPDRDEILRCRRFLEREVAVLEPRLLLAVGNLAITEALGPEHYGKNAKLVDVVGKTFRVRYHGHDVDVVCLPHPSGVSAWPKREPGQSLLARALGIAVAHPAWRSAFKTEPAAMR